MYMALMSILLWQIIKLDFKTGFYKNNYTEIVRFFWLIKMCSALPQN